MDDLRLLDVMDEEGADVVGELISQSQREVVGYEEGTQRSVGRSDGPRIEAVLTAYGRMRSEQPSAYRGSIKVREV